MNSLGLVVFVVVVLVVVVVPVGAERCIVEGVGWCSINLLGKWVGVVGVEVWCGG